MFSQLFESDRPNLARYIFLDPCARGFYSDWDLACSLTAAMLRYTVGRDPLNSELTALVGELAALSPVFRSHWAAQDVHEHRHGRKLFHHPEVGDLEADYDPASRLLATILKRGNRAALTAGALLGRSQAEMQKRAAQPATAADGLIRSTSRR